MPADSEVERRRLAGFYAQMSDGELEKLASEAAGLTDDAREILAQEIERRGLALALSESAADDPVPEFRKLVAVGQFRDLHEALMAKGALEASGIEAFLGDENIVRMDWFISNLVGGVKLSVSAEDVQAAREVLSGPMLEEFDVEGVGRYEQPRCPKCNSVEITYEELNKPLSYGSAWLGVPLPIARQEWKCEACGHRWRETQPADDSPPEPAA